MTVLKFFALYKSGVYKRWQW